MLKAITAFLITVLLPLAVAADVCDGKVVRGVLFVGCKKGACSSGSVQKKLISLSDLLESTFSPEALTRAEDRLKKSGYFLEVDSDCGLDEAGEAVVTFAVVPNRFIRRVEITGVNVLYRSELKKRLFLRKGTPFNPDKAESLERLSRQVSGLLTYIRQQGFDAATVKPAMRLVEPDLVDIVLRVDEGKVVRVDSIQLFLEQTKPAEDAQEYGCPAVSKRVLEGLISVSRGDVYTAQIKRKIKKEIQFFTQKYGFIVPKVDVGFDDNTGKLDVKVRLDKCFSVLVQERDSYGQFGTGYAPSKESEIFGVMPFKESGVFDEAEADRGLDEVLAYYRVRGYLFAQIEMQYVDYREQEDGWPHPLLGGIIYRVTKGPHSEIREIRFEGARQKTPEELEALIETRRYDFFDVGGYLDAEQLFADLETIRGEYQRTGFFRMGYEGVGQGDEIKVEPERKGDEVHWRYSWRDKVFTVIQRNWESPVTVVIRIDEGVGSRVGAVSFDGVKAIEEEELLKETGLKEGMGYSGERLKKAVAAVEGRYRRMGYTPKVKVSCTAEAPEVGREQCEPYQVRSERVNLVFEVEEGERSIMGEILVSGNLSTKPSVIERDFPPRGKPLNWTKVDEAVRRLRNSGTFTSVKLSPIGTEEEPARNMVAMAVQVEEATTEFLDLSVGFQTITRLDEQVSMAPWARDWMSNSLYYTGSPLSGSASLQSIAFPDVLLMGEFAYYEHNFLGLQKSVILPVQYGLSTTDPFRYASFMPTYLDRRIFGSDVTFRATPLIVYDQALKLLDTFEYGGEVEVSYPIIEGMYISWLNRLTRIQWKYSYDEAFGPMEFQLKSAPQIRYDWRDSPINPTRGGMAVGRVTYLNALNQDAARDNFWKFEVGLQYFLALRRTVVIGAHVKAGDSISPSGLTLPENERFRLGGANGIRGFTYGGIGQYDSDGSLRVKEVTEADGTVTVTPVVGGDIVLNGSLEVRFPLLRKSELWGAVFADWGALSDQWADLNGSSFRFSTGFGIRYLIGGQIPLRLDYGVVLDKRCARVDSTGACEEQEDAGALDFGLLYTF